MLLACFSRGKYLRPGICHPVKRAAVEVHRLLALAEILGSQTAV